MEQKQFEALMPYVCADLVAAISENRGISSQEAIDELYASKLYAYLEQEETKVWHYSTPMLYSLLQQEEMSGTIQFPDV